MTDSSDINSRWPGDGEDERSLADAYTRLNEARSDMRNLESEIKNFVRQTVAKMVRGYSKERNSFVVSLPPAKLAHKGEVNNKIRLLCGSVSENLRAALDYGIMRVSQDSCPGLVEKDVKFVLAKDKNGFDGQAKKALKHVDEDIKRWVEQLQPYHGNEILAFIRDTSNIAKHRSLLTVKHATSLTIVLRENADQNKQLEGSDWWIFPAGRGHTYFARVGSCQLIVRKKYDALTVLPICIEHVHGIVDMLEYYMQNGQLPGEARRPQE